MVGKKKTKSLESPKTVEAVAAAVEGTTAFSSRSAGEGKIKKRISMSTRAGIQMPCARILKHLQRGNYAKHIQKGEKIGVASFEVI